MYVLSIELDPFFVYNDLSMNVKKSLAKVCFNEISIFGQSASAFQESCKQFKRGRKCSHGQRTVIRLDVHVYA